jgi:hypothetical protein
LQTIAPEQQLHVHGSTAVCSSGACVENSCRSCVAFVIRTFELMLLKRAYTREALDQMAAQSCVGRDDVVADGIGCELRLKK